MAQKTATLYARVEPDVKEQAESILSELGIPASTAIDMFYRQVIFHRGLPFAVTLPPWHPLALEDMGRDDLSAVLEKGYQDASEGRTRPAEDVEAELGRVSEK